MRLLVFVFRFVIWMNVFLFGSHWYWEPFVHVSSDFIAFQLDVLTDWYFARCFRFFEQLLLGFELDKALVKPVKRKVKRLLIWISKLTSWSLLNTWTDLCRISPYIVLMPSSHSCRLSCHLCWIETWLDFSMLLPLCGWVQPVPLADSWFCR